jgi:copper transport protein
MEVGLLRRAITVAAACVVLVLAAAGPTFAHTELDGSEPADGSTVPALPTSVTLTFSEPVSTPPDAIRVIGPDGQRVDDDHVTHPGDAGARVAVGLAGDAGPGTYLVNWRVVSDDSHPVAGTFTFSVVAPSPLPMAKPTTTPRGIAAALGLTRWLSYLGACLLLGGAGFLTWCWPAGRQVRRARRLVYGGALTLVVSSMAALLLKGPYDAGVGLEQLLDPDLLLEVLGSTWGRGMLTRLTLATAAVAWFEWGRPTGRYGAALGTVGGVALAGTFGFTGHAVAGPERALAQVSDLVHVGAMSLWLGGLVSLTAVALPRISGGERLAVLRRFSRVAAGSVVALVGTGLFQAWRGLASWPAITATTYGRELLVKTSVVLLMLLAAAASRAWLQRRGQGGWIRASVATEAALGLVILGLTSSLVATEPGRTAYHPTVTVHGAQPLTAP